MNSARQWRQEFPPPPATTLRPNPMSFRVPILALVCLAGLALSTSGCLHLGSCGGCGPRGLCRGGACGYDAGACGCDPCGCDPHGGGGWRQGRCGPCGGCRHHCGAAAVGGVYQCTANKLTNADIALCNAFYRRSGAIPDTLPLGSTVRAWYQVSETNAEAADFIIHVHDFVGDTARLTPDGRDHIWEIAARMRSVPFPIIVERSENNSNPELDSLRRQLVVSVLTSFGNADADQRTVVSMPYGPGYNAIQAEPMYYQHIGGGGGGNNFGSFGNNLGQFGGFGGGGGGGIGFGF
jgi:hypothetical protein